MKSICQLLLLISLVFVNTIVDAQSTETFEDESVDSSSFSNGGETFNVTSTEGFDVYEFTNGGWNGTTTDNKFIDNSSGTSNNTGTSFTIKQSDDESFCVLDLYLFCAQSNLQNSNH